MKKGFGILAIVVSLVGCATLGHAADKVFRIGISQIVEHPALDAVRKGFIDFLGENGFKEGERVKYDYKNAQNNRSVSGLIARKLVGDKVDLILSISTPSSQDAAAAAKSIPILFAAVTDPVVAGLVESLDKPGRNISGTTDKSPVGKQLDLIKEILPNAGILGTIYNAGEVNSVVSVELIKTAAARRGMKVLRAVANSSSAVKPAAESLLGKVDLMLIPPDNTAVQSFESIVKVCRDNRVPLFASDVDSVKRGAIAALALDYYKLGRRTGAMAKRILEGKVKISEMPVESQKELLLYLNPKQAEKMGVKLSPEMVKRAAKIID
jgi:putative ABC transport system substrate-binding protein